MNRRPVPQWSYRVLDFGAGVLLSLLLYVGTPETSKYHSWDSMLLVAMIFGTIAAVFGRRFWRFVRRWVT